MPLEDYDGPVIAQCDGCLTEAVDPEICPECDEVLCDLCMKDHEHAP